MIISTIGSTSRTLGAGEEIRWRSLARRGMLHCECESFDHLRLAPGTEFALRGQEGTESVWFTVSGSGRLLGVDASPAGRVLGAGELVLLPAGKECRLASGQGGLELLWLTVMPREVSQSLPNRKPVA
jgi:mannose-6-phosphate isomerase-like protein (cupin superfamily)